MDGTRADTQNLAGAIGITPSEVTEDANRVDLGLDSLYAIRLTTAWNRGAIPVVFDDLVAKPTLTGWKTVLDAASTSASTSREA